MHRDITELPQTFLALARIVWLAALLLPEKGVCEVHLLVVGFWRFRSAQSPTKEVSDEEKVGYTGTGYLDTAGGSGACRCRSRAEKPQQLAGGVVQG
jgi:hypothetical protein